MTEEEARAVSEVDWQVEFYSEKELEQLREWKREANRLAREEAIRRGVKLHPKIAVPRRDRGE